MKQGLLLTIVCIFTMTATACVPRQTRPVSEIDPTIMLEAVTHRREDFEKGLSGILEMDFKQGGKRFSGKTYIIAFPDGPFRLEIPGPMGSTLMVMVNDGKEVTAYYPEKGEVYLSLTEGLSINPHLPFPLPLETDMLTALLMGTTPENSHISETRAYVLESGERRLWTRSDSSGLEYTYLFTKGPAISIRLVNAYGDGLDLKVATQKTPPYLPADFSLTFQDTTITGDWEKVVMFDGDKTVLKLDIPESVSITDLRDHH
jgi:hypothetical protein